VLLIVALTVSVPAWAQPEAWVINSRGDFSDSTRIGALWTVDLATGQAELEGRSRIDAYIFIEGLSFSADGELFGVDDDTNTLVRLGTSSGNAVAVNQAERNLDLPLANHDFGLSFTCDGRLLVSTDSGSLGSALYEADPATGKALLIGETGAPIVDLATIGDQVFGIGRGMASEAHPASPNLYLVDPVGGEAALIGPLGSAVDSYNKAGLATDADGTLWAVTERRSPSDPDRSIASQIIRIDPHTGMAEHVAYTQATEYGQELVGVESLAVAPPGDCDRGIAPVQPAVVPVMTDPGRWLLVLCVLALAAFSLRRAAAS
jgi:hypothetical protein